MLRAGVDVHNGNPADELNLRGVFEPGVVNDFNGHNYGFPKCVTVWDETVLKNTTLRRAWVSFPTCPGFSILLLRAQPAASSLVLASSSHLTW